MTINEESKIKIVKGIIFLFTALILMGVGLAIYGVSRDKEEAENKENQKKIGFDPITIKAEKGTSIKEISECGKMLCIVIKSKAGENVLVMDPITGQLQGSINLLIDNAKK